MDMPGTRPPTSEVAFTASVKALQRRHGSRDAYARLEGRGGWRATVTPELAAFIAARDSFYFATASAAGQPYVQHRGGPKGFLKVLDERRLAFADLRGNRQYITAGNLMENPRAFIFLMDYESRRRVKLWGTATVADDLARLLPLLGEPGGKPPEFAVVFTLVAWDENCPRHITRRFSEERVAAALQSLRARIAELEAENARLRLALGDLPSTPS
jgi:predicted pyridoxine 5'-phosphate oxidase superfamily flavin-nucleotide-binding protein